MKILFFVISVLSLSAFASIDELFQYPEDRNYTSQDRGMMPYRALSLYKTGTYTLTFDDGPHPIRTPKILDVLKKHETKAIFFVLSSKLNDSTFPIVKRMLDEGHIVASHGVKHDRSGAMTEKAWKDDVKQSFLEIAEFYKRAGHIFDKHYYRFPYGDYGTRAEYHHINALKDVSQELMGENCIHMAFWDIDTADWVAGMTPAEVSGNMIAHHTGGRYVGFKNVNGKFIKNPYTLKNPPIGGVILQHDIHEVNIKATDLFLTYAKENYLSIPRIDEIEEFRITKNCTL